MKAKKSFWASITGGLTSATPILLSCCKSGACVGVCASPIASLFGVSSTTLANSPLISALEPVLIAVSAVSFTISYYSLYILPKLNCNTPDGCVCDPTAKEKRKVKINKAVFWTGLILSIGFLSYFEISKYQASTAANTECSTTECAPGSCSEDTATEESCTTSCDSTSSCCTNETNTLTSNNMELSCKLTSPELQKRKETVIAELKKEMLEKKELPNGFAFKFKGDDQTIDKLNEFIKSERQCCDFFIFDLSVSGNKSEVWLKMTGSKEAKDFITSEIGL